MYAHKYLISWQKLVPESAGFGDCQAACMHV